MNILDIIVVLIIVIVTAYSARKGFLLTLFNISAYIIAGIFSRIISLPTAQYIYNNYLNKRIISVLYEIMPTGSINGTFSSVMEEIFDYLPPYVASFIRQFNIVPEKLFLNSENVQFTAEMLESEYLNPIITNITSIIVNVLLFMLFSVILKIVLHFINSILTANNHGFFSKTNTLLGAVFGIIKGVIPAGLICALITVLSPALNNAGVTELVAGSYCCKIVLSILS